MATSILLKPRNFDPTNVSFSAPRQIGTSGAKMLYLNYNNESLSIQLPNLMVGWDIKFFEDKPGSGKYQVSLKFNDFKISFPTFTSLTGSSDKDTLIVSPIPLINKAPNPIDDLILPGKKLPASVIPRCKG